jgi:hypothetical protein
LRQRRTGRRAARGLRFTVTIEHGRERAGIRGSFSRRVHAYLNRCGHVPVELDWQPASSSIIQAYT